MRIAELYIRRGRAWLVALLLVLFAAAVIALVPEAERDASPTDSLAQGFDSTRVVELADEFPEEGGSSALVLFTADSGELTDEQVTDIRAILFERLDALHGVHRG